MKKAAQTEQFIEHNKELSDVADVLPSRQRLRRCAYAGCLTNVNPVYKFCGWHEPFITPDERQDHA